MSILQKFFFTVFGGVMAAQDMKTRSVSLLWCMIFAVFGALLAAFEAVFMMEKIPLWQWILKELGGMAVGLGLLGLSKITGGAIGEGDGLFFLTAAIYLGTEKTFLLLVYGMTLCGIVSGILLVYGWLRHKPMGKKELPLLPFLFPVEIWLMYIKG